MIKWGILSTAKIATEQIIPAILESKNSIIYGIASRDLKKAKKLMLYINHYQHHNILNGQFLV